MKIILGLFGSADAMWRAKAQTGSNNNDNNKMESNNNN